MSPRNATEIGTQRLYTLPDGREVPSVTTILNVLDKPWMGPWAAKLVAEAAFDGLLREKDTAAVIAGWAEADWLAHEASLTHQKRHKHHCDFQASAVAWLKGVPFRKRDEAADFGTAVHEVAEAIAYDLPFAVPTNAEGHVDALRAWYEAYRPDVLAVEGQVGTYDYAGSFDLLARVNGVVYLIDLKTSKSLDPKWRLQIAAYMAGEPFLDGEWMPWPEEPDAGAVLWVPSDRPEQWQFLEVHLLNDDYRGFEHAVALHRWTQTYKNDAGMTLVLPQAEEME